MIFVYAICLILNIIIAILFWTRMFPKKEKRVILRKCYSKTCLKNDHGKCMLKEIDVYDNGVLGLCLWHSHNMQKRTLEPFQVVLGMKTTHDVESDIKAIQDSEEFQKWMRRHIQNE